MTKFALVPMLALLPMLLPVSGCGPVRYVPIEMLSPLPAEDPARSRVEAELQIGREWLEVRVHNAGPSPVQIDWGQASFIAPTGEAHSLLSSARLHEIYRYWSMRQSRPQYGAFMLGSTTPLGAWMEHRLPFVLEHETREVAVVLKAGESIQEVLYPVEHVRVGESGELSVGFLFCGRGSGVRSSEAFTVRIPVQKGNQQEIVTLAARLR